MNDRLRKALKNRKGFTAVELVVTMVIGAILAAALTAGVLAYIHYAQFRKQNEYAQSLYLAAQTQLTRMSQRGALASLETLTADRVVPLGDIVTEDGESGSASLVYRSGDARYQGTVCYLTGTAADYAAYLAGTADEETTALYDLFSLYLYDKSILNATVCVEFDPAEGLVYSVLYCDTCGDTTAFTYDGAGSSVNISDRTYAVRKGLTLGYYGVDTLSKATSTRQEKPVISNVALHNDETLHLTFRLSRVESAVGELTYTVQVKDKIGGGVLMTLVMNDPSDTGEFSRLVASDQLAASLTSPHVVSCAVTGAAGSDITDGDYLFPAWIDSDGTVTLVLDAVDLGATESAYNYYGSAGLSDTFSLRRFGITADSICCTVQGSGDIYKTTARKQSNAEDPCFGGTTTSGDASTHALYNARHLYNIRFSELDAAEDPTLQPTYTLAGSFSWKTILGDGWVYRSVGKNPATLAAYRDDALKAPETEAFPMISALGSTSTLTSSGSYAISDLKIVGTGSRTGLFRGNSGTMEKVKLDNITVSGKDYTGAFCGENKGSMNDLAVLATEKSTVTGLSYVGGVFGYAYGDSAASAGYAKLVNHAKVSGTSYVGGIGGYLYTDYTVNGLVSACRNYGQVSGTTQCIGGVLGIATTMGTLTVKNCTSDMGYTAAEETALLKNLAGRLTGSYVGGIVGLDNGAAISGCSTGKGYLVGGSYVGGIVGLASSVFHDSSIDNAAGASENRLNVIGKNYVGGIIGRNESAYVLGTGTLAGFANTQQKLTGLVNRGIAVATEGYAGGIAGYNAGIITDCRSDTEYSETLKAYATGSYAGGIAGYNKGTIQSGASAPVSNVVAVFGGNYVGGVVGYNTAGAVLTNYAVAGGYVTGDTFVGGLAGVNESVNLLGGAGSLTVNPNLVEGNLCVGGVIGGNLVNPAKNLAITCQVSNHFGRVTAKKAVAGGFLGYNNVGSVSAATVAAALKNKSLAGVYQALAAYPGNSSRVLTIQGASASSPASVRLSAITAGICAGGVIGYNAANTRLYIRYVTNYTPVTAASSIASAEQGSGDSHTYSYAGGVIGRVSEYTVVESCANAERGGASAAGSYAGGVAEVNAGVIYNCKVGSIGDGSRSGLGGIVGVNLKRATRDFPAGVLTSGLPFLSGSQIRTGIYSCTVTGTVTGTETVGGIAAENLGLISGCAVSDRVVASGGTVGGFVGHNAASGALVLTGTSTLSVSASGSNVGGLIGVNEGTFSADAPAGDFLFLSASSSVQGASNVGGLIGLQSGGSVIGPAPMSPTQYYYVNCAAVTASEGNAGGIVGKAADAAFTIRYCANVGAVQATLRGNAGGIVAYTGAGAAITGCVDGADVSAYTGSAGGITAENFGTVSTCSVNPYPVGNGGTLLGTIRSWLASLRSALAGGSRITVTGNVQAGGIAAVNEAGAMLTDVSAASVTVANISTGQDGAYLGGVAGSNLGTVLLPASALTGVRVQTYTNYGCLGGAAGVNGGSIGPVSGLASAALGSTDGSVTVGFASGSGAVVGSFGGAVGSNLAAGSVERLAVRGDVMGEQGDSAMPTNGYGGVAGVSAGRIAACSFDGTVYANGNGSFIANVGGIVGWNGAAGRVESCAVGTAAGTTSVVRCGSSNAAYGFVGGIAGRNQGSVLNCDNASLSLASVYIANYAGHTGGLVGRNESGGVITGTAPVLSADGSVLSAARRTSTGGSWQVAALYYDNDNGLGGIAGYSASGSGMAYVENYARVTYASGSTASNSNAGGFIGRLENSESSTLTFDHCVNYGDVADKLGIAGGFVGTLKYNGCTFASCGNYGAIGGNAAVSGAMSAALRISASTGGTAYAGGFIGRVYAISGSGVLTISGSENHGSVAGSTAAAGFVGYATASSGGSAWFADCVNTGCISGGAAGGIACNLSGGIKDRNFLRCRNYGLGAGAGSTAFAASYSGSFAGICYDSSAASTLSGCFDCSNAAGTPISNRGGNTVSGYEDNYYIAQGAVYADTGTRKETAAIGGVELTYKNSAVSAQGGYAAANAYDGSAATQYRSNALGGSASGDAPAVLTAVLKTPASLQSVGLLFGTSGGARTYTFTLSYTLQGQASAIPMSETFTAGSGTEKVCPLTYGGSALTADQLVTGLTVTITGVKQGAADTPYVVLSELSAYTGGMVSTGTVTGGIANAVGLPLAPSDSGTEHSARGCAMDGTAVALTGLAVSADSRAAEYRTDSSVWQTRPAAYANGGSPRYRLYYTLEDAVAQYYKAKYAAPAIISSVTVSDAGGGAYTAAWTVEHDQSVYAFEVGYQITPSAAAPSSFVPQQSFTTAGKFWTMDLSAYQGQYVTVGVRSVYFKATGFGYEQAKGPWTLSAPTLVKQALPIPQIHLELVPVSGTNAYRYKVVLENQTAYTALGAGASVISVSGAGSVSFTAGEGESSAAVNIGTTQNYTLLCSAAAAGAYGASAVRVVQTKLYAPGSLQSTDYCGTAFNGFYGSSAADLFYSVAVSQLNKPETYYSIELVAADSGLGGLQVALASSEVHVTELGGTQTALLSNLPADLIRDGASVIVRTYPWSTQAYMSYFGHTVAAGLSASEVLALSDGGTAVVSGGAVAPGYVIRRDGDGTYRVLYSVLLANEAYFEKQIDQRAYTVSGGVITASGESYPVRTAPVISTALTENAAGTAIALTWDEGVSGASTAGYYATVIGSALDGRTAELYSGAVTGNTLELAEDGSWNYTVLHVTVERVGETNAGGKTTVFPCGSRADLAVKLNLPQITAPAINFHRTGEGTVEMNTMSFDLSWAGLTAESQRSALSHYEVTCSGTDAAGAAHSETLRTDSLSAGTTAAADSAGRVTLSGVDLNGFAPDSVVTISVRAIARAEAEQSGVLYASSRAGVPLSYTLPPRCSVPTGTLAISDGSPMTVSGFESGVTLAMTGASGAGTDSQEKYQLTAEIYDAQNGALQTTLAAAAAPLTMDGTLASSAVSLQGISAAYAGRWLKVTARVVSAIRFSSVWSEPIWLRLPQVQLDYPALSAGFENIDGFQQAALRFSAADYAGGYELTVVHSASGLGAPDAAVVTLTGSGSSYAVGWQSTGALGAAGTLTAGGADMALASWIVLTGSGEAAAQIPLTMYLRLSGGVFTLILPAESTDDYNVVLRALPADGTRYVPSLYYGWMPGGAQTAPALRTADAVTLAKTGEGTAVYSLTNPYKALLLFDGGLFGMAVDTVNANAYASSLSHGADDALREVWLLTPPWGFARPAFTVS